jgi:hypothetical protein
MALLVALSAFRKKISLRFESPPQKRGTIAIFSCSDTCAAQPEWMVSMRKLLLGMALTMPIAFLSPATALPLAHPVMHGAAVNADLIEVKGGRGHGHGWGRGHGYRPFGWSRGRKVGWRGRGCPPGHWKKGWC